MKITDNNIIDFFELLISEKHAFEFFMLIYTAIMVPVTDFLTGVLSALIIYFVFKKLFFHEFEDILHF